MSMSKYYNNKRSIMGRQIERHNMYCPVHVYDKRADYYAIWDDYISNEAFAAIIPSG